MGPPRPPGHRKRTWLRKLRRLRGKLRAGMEDLPQQLASAAGGVSLAPARARGVPMKGVRTPEGRGKGILSPAFSNQNLNVDFLLDRAIWRRAESKTSHPISNQTAKGDLRPE